MHLNIQGLAADKISSLEVILEDNNIDICCLSEHWQDCNIRSMSIGNYRVVSFFQRSEFLRGGVCILARTDLDFNLISVDELR